MSQIGESKMFGQQNSSTLVIGDIHGRDVWSRIVPEFINSRTKDYPVNKVVFLGDYFDTFDKISHKEQVDNFIEILKYKRYGTVEVVLLFGNHDFHYYQDGKYGRYSGRQEGIQKLLNERIPEEFGISYESLFHTGVLVPWHIEPGVIYSHAGIGDYRLYSFISHCEEENGKPEKPLSDEYAMLGKVPMKYVAASDYYYDSLSSKIYDLVLAQFCYNPSDTTGCGDDRTQTPIRIRPAALQSAISNPSAMTQVIGHTTVKEAGRISRNGNIVACDALHRSQGQFVCMTRQLPTIYDYNFNQ